MTAVTNHSYLQRLQPEWTAMQAWAVTAKKIAVTGLFTAAMMGIMHGAGIYLLQAKFIFQVIGLVTAPIIATIASRAEFTGMNHYLAIALTGAALTVINAMALVTCEAPLAEIFAASLFTIVSVIGTALYVEVIFRSDRVGVQPPLVAFGLGCGLLSLNLIRPFAEIFNAQSGLVCSLIAGAAAGVAAPFLE